ncbi:helix-turn-helix transcriptional regulator [Clostridium sp. BL-8]|uniref:substrate-binding domain-containing protein n=1 Tax=Clostridium sp. BL-8 TaxID=349938 RepID=UPI00098C495B|nr:helix-turn-helix transcriptional regulator [Clostridium sp. BL-8]OOM79522.1 PBP superfamily domain protein [Clostridium sp. BL-8]
MKTSAGLSTQEVAEILNISKNTVYELIKRGELVSYRIGRKVRVDEKDIEEYKNRTRTSVKIQNLKKDENKNSAVNIPNYSSLNYSQTVNNNKNKDFIICGQDILLDVLARHLERHPKGLRALRRYIGSYNGLVEFYRGNVSVATAHLWDGSTGEYNLSYIPRLLPGISCIVVHLVCRMQGFYVSKGNPKRINSWIDLTRPDILMINREKGCGVRVLIDEQFKIQKIDHNQVRGYEHEELSHLAVASTVARGDADVGVGNEKTALQVENIDFVPIQKERYDLIIKQEDLNTPAIQAVLEILNSADFKLELQGIGGYDISETGKITILN